MNKKPWLARTSHPTAAIEATKKIIGTDAYSTTPARQEYRHRYDQLK